MTKEEKQWMAVLAAVFAVVLMICISFACFYLAFSAIENQKNANVEKRYGK